MQQNYLIIIGIVCLIGLSGCTDSYTVSSKYDVGKIYCDETGCFKILTRDSSETLSWLSYYPDINKTCIEELKSGKQQEKVCSEGNKLGDLNKEKTINMNSVKDKSMNQVFKFLGIGGLIRDQNIE